MRWMLATIPRLGLRNVLYTAYYRATLKSGARKVWLPSGKPWDGDFFTPLQNPQKVKIDGESRRLLAQEVENLHAGRMRFFSAHEFDVGDPPHWFCNPFTGARLSEPNTHWVEISDFSAGVGDIKTVWEPSRFDWAVKLAQAHRVTGDARHCDLLNRWISSWTAANPLNRGPNWKCGQETSIRLLHVLLSGFFLQQLDQPTPALTRFVDEHCTRIAATIRYAIAQNNNHGTSEAAALFVAGSWLKRQESDESASTMTAKAENWSSMGRIWLEDRVKKLIFPDGSFSQSSVTYHRLLLDTLSVSKFWQMAFDLRGFSETFRERARAAVHWLYQLVDDVSGDAPNLGGNDGAQLLPLSACDYRDFRPSVQLGAALFCDATAFPSGPWDEALRWLDVKVCHDSTARRLTRSSQTFPGGGFVVMRSHKSWALVRTSNTRFRPPHSDLLHLDLWHKGCNVIRDGGSFSYNCEPELYDDFTGTRGHSTVEFDSRDQMPRIGRFLFGAWTAVKTQRDLTTTSGGAVWQGAYTDYRGCTHQRRVEVSNDRWLVRDTVSGFRRSAVLRWRLAPENWSLDGNACESSLGRLEIDAGDASIALSMTAGWESLYYLRRTQLPVLEAKIEQPGTYSITTSIHLS